MADRQGTSNRSPVGVLEKKSPTFGGSPVNVSGTESPHGKHHKHHKEGDRKKRKKHKDRDKERSHRREQAAKEAGNSSGTESQGSTSSRSDNKREMLKFMIHEVRELRKVVDPTLTDLHRHKKKQPDEQVVTSQVATQHESEKDGVYTKTSNVHKSVSTEQTQGDRVIRKQYNRTETVTVQNSNLTAEEDAIRKQREKITVATSTTSLASCERGDDQLMCTYPPKQVHLPSAPGSARMSRASSTDQLAQTMPVMPRVQIQLSQMAPRAMDSKELRNTLKE